ncbi:MAG: helix-hairpin-helix domain-containing protein [Pseudomonadota bacterium]
MAFSSIFVAYHFTRSAPAPVNSNQPFENTEVSPERRLLRNEKIDLNRATERELLALPGVGPKLAGEIIKNRTKKGPFPTVESLTRVRGIGPKKLQKIRSLVIVGQKGSR